MGRTVTYGSRPAFAVDPESLVRNSGRQVDWNYVPDSYRSSTETITMAAAAAAGATSLTVEALPVAVLSGTILNFGSYAPVTVTVAITTAIGAVAIDVNALSGPIPAGTFLDFGVEIARTSAAAVAGAVSIAVDATETAIESADTALFPGGTLQARVTANAAAGATALTVDELQFAIADDLTATVGGVGVRTIPAGTVMAELSTGKVVPRAVRPGAETATGLIETAALEGDRSASLSGYGMVIGGAVYENLLPEATGGPPAVLNSTYKTELQTAGVGTGFAFHQYGDNSGS